MRQESPGWYSDPTGRFDERYRDAAGWTEHVRSVDGAPATDPPESTAASQAAGPYEAAGRPMQGPTGSPGPSFGYVLSLGGLIASVGAFLVLLSVVGGMNFITLENIRGGTDGMSLSAVANNNSSVFTIEDRDFGVTGSYAAFGGYAGALLGVPLAVMTGLRRRVGAVPPGAAPQPPSS
jgi:hypothetical protein